MQNLVNELPDAFTDHKKVIRSHIPAVNAPERVQIPLKATNSTVSSPNPRKRGRPSGARDKVLRRCPQRQVTEPLKESVEEAQPEVENAPEVAARPGVELVPEGRHPKDGNHHASERTSDVA